MNETQRRIKAYKAALPGLRERVIAVALLLAMSVAMMTSATFAWLTISRAPEVTGTNTTVAANGNLEIALVNPEGEKPLESKIGDSSAAMGQSVANANLTWGNLVNLADPSYGLDKITLRPAMLSTSGDLLNNPLVSVIYAQDGRTQSTYNEDFGFTYWNDARQFFETTPYYGVRAISTIEYKIQDSTQMEYRALRADAAAKIQAAKDAYREIVGPSWPANNDPNNHNANIKAIADMLGEFISKNLTDSLGSMNCTGYILDLYPMMLQLAAAYGDVETALEAMANVQVFNLMGAANYKDYLFDRTDPDARKLTLLNNNVMSANTSALTLATGKVVKLDSLSSYISGVNKLNEVIAQMKPFYDKAYANSSTSIYWTDEIEGVTLETIINKIVVIATCTVKDGPNGKELAASGLASDLSTALGLMGSKQIYGKIKTGLIVDFENLVGESMDLHYVKVVTSIKTMTVYSITTAATFPGKIDKDFTKNCSSDLSSNSAEGSAQDTYGLAVDLWARTNIDNSYLILEGHTVTMDREEPATLSIPGGDTVQLYTATITYPPKETEEGESGGSGGLGGAIEDLLGDSETVDVYKLKQKKTIHNEDDTTSEVEVEVWYFADTHAPVYATTTDDDGNEVQTPTRGESISISGIPKVNVVSVVIGFEGENRVWTDWEKENLTADSTTQGSGSCYVFYADNPTDQENILKLLSNFRVTFLNEAGTAIAMARLDTVSAYSTPGKVTVPLVLMTDKAIVNPTYAGNELAIMPLNRNEATRMTMLVYLDGTNLTNDQVLAANDIQGRLNIQFGTSAKLYTTGDTELKMDEVHVSATVENTNFDYDTATGPMISHIKINVDGINPAVVKANFVRQINATQGSREEDIVFDPPASGNTWTKSYEFTAPGTYVLRSVQLDGQEYDLKEPYPTVTVQGFGIRSVSCGTATAGKVTAVLTDRNTYSTTVAVQFATDDPDKVPTSVQAQFVPKGTGDPVTVLMTQNATSFVGTATFTNSGTYTLKYIIMDGNYVELEEGKPEAEKQLYTLNLTLGVYVRVMDNVDDTSWEYEGNSIPVGMTIEIRDKNGILSGLQNVQLHYRKDGTDLGAPNVNLTWDSGSKTYTNGTMQLVTPGTYYFDFVKIGNDFIYQTTGDVPFYSVVSPNPPVYKGNLTAVYQFMGGVSSGAKMEIEIGHAESALVTAVLENTSRGTTYEVTPDQISKTKVRTEQGVDIYKFTINLPTDDQVYGQDGIWTLKELRLAEVCDDDKAYHSSEDPWIWSFGTGVSAQDVVTKEIADTVTTEVQSMKLDVSTAQAQGQPSLRLNYGDSSDSKTYVFMESATNNQPFTITITDKLNRALKVELSEMVVKYTHKGQSNEKYGGYSNDVLDTDTEKSYTLKLGSDGKTYTIPAGTIQMAYAGEYTCTSIDFSVENQNFHYSGSAVPAKMPKFSLTTTVPTVYISDITMDGSGAYSVDTFKTGSIADSVTSSGGCLGVGATNNFTTHKDHLFAANNKNYISKIDTNKLTAWIYFKCSHKDVTGYEDSNFKTYQTHSYNYNNGEGVPAATLTISGMGNATDAELIFKEENGGNVIMITQYTADRSGGTYWGDYSTYGTDRFVWTSTNTSCKRFIGIMDNGAGEQGSDTKTAAGTIKSSELILTYGGVDYKFTIPEITIHNDY